MTLERLALTFAMHNVTLIDAETLLCSCNVCGAGFAPVIQPGGKLRRRSWQWPNRCNARVERRSDRCR